MKCKMTAKARVNPTEDVDKVITAISNIFEFDELEIGDGYILVTGDKESLRDLRESLKSRKIRDTAERMFIKGSEGDRIIFSLKQTGSSCIDSQLR